MRWEGLAARAGPRTRAEGLQCVPEGRAYHTPVAVSVSPLFVDDVVRESCAGLDEARCLRKRLFLESCTIETLREQHYFSEKIIFGEVWA